MKIITLLPADSYMVVNKTLLSEIDRKNLISLYEPIVGPLAVSLYLTLWHDLDIFELTSKEFNHHHLMSILKSNLEDIKKAREGLEAIGLLKSYLKSGDINNYVYELYSPLSAVEFFNHPIFNIVLYNNIGKEEYDLLKWEYEKVKIDLTDYEDISKTINNTFKSINNIDSFSVRERTTNKVLADNGIDFDLLISSLPKGLINDKAFNKANRELMNNLAFVYNIDTLKFVEILRLVINEKGFIDKEELRKAARKYYQFNNGTLPTLVYRSQPEYLKQPLGDTSKKSKIIYVFENTSPYDFLKSKYKGTNPTNRDLKILENLLVDVGLKPAVINVLVDYVLRRDNNKLNTAFVETIAGQWKRVGVETAKDAMNLAEKEHKKYSRKQPVTKTNYKNNKEVEPVWFNEVIEKEETSDEERAELDEFLKEFR